jgi:uncharacterized Ntn-hydrolase superfamily protein
LGAVASQAYADPRLLPIAMQLLQTGFSAAKVIQELATSDKYFDYRQVGVVDRDGGVAVHTGAETTPWAGHITGDGFVALGNCLAGEHVVQAIASTFTASEAHNLEERLLRAIEAGRDAGGQNPPMRERSAALVVYEYEPYALIDLRVDVHDDAITELRRARQRAAQNTTPRGVDTAATGQRLDPLTLADRHLCHGIALANGIDDILSADHLAKDRMSAIEVRLRRVRDKELTPIGVRPGIGHRDHARLMGQRVAFELIFEPVARSTPTGAGGIAPLDHKVTDHAVKRHTVVKALSA